MLLATSAGGATDSFFYGNIGTSAADQHRDFAIGSDDAMYFACRGNGDATIVKVDIDGTFQWARSLDDSDGKIYNFNGVSLDSSDNVYVSGSRIDTSTQPFSRKCFLFKYNSSGTVQFKKEFGTYQDLGHNITLNSGRILFPVVDGLRFIEFDSSGTAQTNKVIGSSSVGYSFQSNEVFRQDSSNNIYVMGNDASSGNQRILIVKMNSSYVIQWQRTFHLDTGNANEDTLGTAFDVDSSGNVYVSGFTRSTSPEQSVIFKLNSSGTLQWQKGYGNQFYVLDSLSVDSNDDIYVSGRVNETAPSGTSGNRLGLLKLDSSGTIDWQNIFAMQDDCDPSEGIRFNSLGTLIVGVKNKGTNTEGSEDLGFLKVPTDGSKTGSYTFGSSAIAYQSMSSSFSSLSGTLSTTTHSITNSSETISTSSQGEVSLTMTASTVAFS